MSDPNLRDWFEQLVSLAGDAREKKLREIKLVSSDKYDQLVELLQIDGENANARQHGSSARPVELDNEIRIGPYTAIRLRSSGATGEVYECISPFSDHEFVAVKVLRSFMHDPGYEFRFEQEQAALERIAHPGVVRVLDSGKAEMHGVSRPFIAMELIEGERLDHYATDQQLTVDQKIALLQALAGGLQAVHLSGVVHRDLKPSNILVRSNGTPVIIDFGVALLQSEGNSQSEFATLTGQLIGTPKYMSPEQILGDRVDFRADIYALGVVAYELLSGMHPHGSERIPITRLSEVVNQSVPVALHDHSKAISRQLSMVIHKCIERRPEDRYSSSAEIRADLEYVQLGIPVHSTPGIDLSRIISRTLLRHPVLTRILAVTTIVLFAAMAAYSIRAKQLLYTTERLAEFEQANDESANLLRALVESGGDIPIEQQEVMLDNLLRSIDEIHMTPIARAVGRAEIAESYGTLKLRDKQFELLPEIVQEHEAVFGHNDRRTVLQLARYAKQLQRHGESAQATEAIHDCFSRVPANIHEKNPDLAGRLEYARGRILYQQGKYLQASEVFDVAALLFQDTLSHETQNLYHYALFYRALAQKHLGELDYAKELLEELLEACILYYGPNSRKAITIQGHINDIESKNAT